MWIKKLVLKNIRRHRLLEVEFPLALTGIVGPNGSGKSTITDSIFSCLTNDFSRFNSLKDLCVTDYAPLEEESSIELDFSHNDVDLNLYRRLRRGAGDKSGRRDNELKLSTGERWVKDNDIRRELEGRLASFKLLSSHIFVAQGQLFNMLSQTPAERALAFQSLCGTLKARTINKAIDDFIKSDPAFTQTVIDDSDELRAKLRQLSADLAQAGGELTVARIGLLDLDMVKMFEATCDKGQRYEFLRGELATLEKSLLEMEPSIANAKRLSEGWAKSKTKAATAVEQTKHAAELAKLNLERVTGWNRAAARQAELQATAQTCEQSLETLQDTRPQPHPRDSEYEELNEQRVREEDEVRRYSATLEAFAADGIVECPTCGTKVTELDAHLTAIRTKLHPLRINIGRLKSMLSEIAGARMRQEDHRKEINQANQELAVATSALEGLHRPEMPTEFDVDKLNAIIKQHGDALDAFKTADQTSQKARDQEVRWQTTYTTALERRKQIVADAAAVMVPAADVKASQDSLAKHRAAELTVAAAAERCNGLRRSEQETQDVLNALKVRLSRVAEMQRLGNDLAAIQEVMHHQGLPQEVAQLNLQDVEEKVNVNLTAFGSPFWVNTTEDLSFTVHFPGEPPRAAEQLSFGQKGVLALALRQAVLSMFSLDLGVMVLDEPTSDLDVANKRFMADAFTKYATTLRGSSQVIVITHADELRNSFDRVLELGAHE